MKSGSLVTKAVGAVGAATLTLGSFASSAFAQFQAGEIEPLSPLNTNDTAGFITNVVNYALAFAGVVAVLYLIWGGITYITAGGDAEKAGKGRTAITNAIIGIVIVLAALVIYNAVIVAGTRTTL